MKNRYASVVVLLALALVLPACQRAGAAEEQGANDIATVEPIAGSDVAAVTLTQESADRLDIQTAAITQRHGRLTIPYAAILYDPEGNTWAYTQREPLVFVRAPIVVERITGDRATLSDGPAAGTEVVVVGAAELLGTEYAVGEE